MSNPYYTRSADFASSTTARGSEVRSEFDYVVAAFNSITDDITEINAAIGNLATGDPPGWGASIDTRWAINDTSTSTSSYTATLEPAPEALDTIADGYSIEFLVNSNNAGEATLNVGSSEGDIPIYKVAGNIYSELDANDMTTLDASKLTFLAGAWVLRRSGSALDVGIFLPYGGTVAPDSYIMGYGQTLSRITYADLYVIIGTTYGNGDGSGTTFSAPDFRGRPFIGYDNIGGTAADVLSSFKTGDLAGADPTPPAYGNWIIRV